MICPFISVPAISSGGVKRLIELAILITYEHIKSLYIGAFKQFRIVKTISAEFISKMSNCLKRHRGEKILS
jgi:hypothetical protein